MWLVALRGLPELYAHDILGAERKLYMGQNPVTISGRDCRLGRRTKCLQLGRLWLNGEAGSEGEQPGAEKLVTAVIWEVDEDGQPIEETMTSVVLNDKDALHAVRSLFPEVVANG